MNGKDLFLGMNHVNVKFVEEAETVTQLKGEKKILSFRRPVLIAAMIGLLLMLVGCGAVIYLTLAEEPWASIPRVEGTDIPKEDIQITITYVSPTYLTYNCDLAGFGTEEKSVFLLRNAPYTIERKTESGWEELPRKIEDVQWNADKILTDGHHGDTIDWSAHYGYLDIGSYRVTTQFVDGHEAITLEFEITEDMQTDSMRMAETLVDQEFWHIRETYIHRYGSLDNVPPEAKDQYLQQPYDGDDDVLEYWKCGDDYLHLMYDGEDITHGMMYKNGVKYKLVREWDSLDAPIVGWMPWPDMDLNRLTAWASYLENERYESSVTYRDDGRIEKLVFTTAERDSLGVDSYFTHNIELIDTSREVIEEVLQEQNTNVWLPFSWEEDQKSSKALDVAFVNTETTPINTAADALALAEKECSVEYNQVMIYRDEAASIWKIEYQIFYGYQGYQYVYLNDDGITVMVSGAGSKVEEWQAEYPGP